MFLWLLLLLLASCQNSNGQSSEPCGCHLGVCLGADESENVNRYYSSHFVCPFYHTNDSYWEGCACLPQDHRENADDYCRCDDVVINCYYYIRNCYYPSSCIPCAGENCKTTRDSCDWYSDCLQWQFPECTGDENYALNYGLHYCSKYVENEYLFSEKGEKWMSSVRTCLQEALIPELSADPQPSCSQLKDNAFDSHELCYTNPGGDNSICYLSCRDLLAVLWTVKGAYLEQFWTTIELNLGVTGSCVVSGSSAGFKVCLVGGGVAAGAGAYYSGIFRLIRVATSWLSRGKRSVDCDEACLAESFTESVFDLLSLPIDHSIEWFAIPEKSGNNFEISVLLTNLAFLNVSTNTSLPPDATDALASAEDQFMSVVTSQKEFTVDGQILEVSQVSTCHDVYCDDATDHLKVDVSAGMMPIVNLMILFCAITSLVGIN